MMEEDDNFSEPCFARALVDGHVVDPQTRHDVGVFRKSERSRLYALRKNQTLDARSKMAANLSDLLDANLGDVSGKIIAAYWPIRGELDLRQWMTKAVDRNARIALPVVVHKIQPVEFHIWTPKSEMKLGNWRIPVPANMEIVTPEIVIIPLLGVDREGFRLGNGGGYYDRTLARLLPQTMSIGVGQDFAQIETIFPMPWDIPMKKVLLANLSSSAA